MDLYPYLYQNSKDLPFLKYYNAQERGRIFTLMLNTAKDTDYIEKLFKQKLRKIKFFTKFSGNISLSMLETELGGFKNLVFLKYYNALKW